MPGSAYAGTEDASLQHVQPSAAPSIAFAELEARARQKDCAAAAEPAPVCRVRRVPSIEEIESMLARGSAVARDGRELTFAYRAAAPGVFLRGGFYFPLSRFVGSDLWTLTLRVEVLDQLAFSYWFMPAESAPQEQRPEPLEWRGPDALTAPERVATLGGVLGDRIMASEYLEAPRTISIYEPPGRGQQPLAGVVYFADGQSLSKLARAVEPLIVSGRLPRLLLVGIHASPGSQRWYEYAWSLTRGRAHYERHEKFFLRELIPRIERDYAVPRDRESRILHGYSNGADWAITSAHRRPDLFCHVIAMSPAWEPAIDPASLCPDATFYVGTGTLEGSFHETALKLRDLLQAHGVTHRLRQEVTGHEMVLWEGLLPDALEWTLSQRPDVR